MNAHNHHSYSLSHGLCDYGFIRNPNSPQYVPGSSAVRVLILQNGAKKSENLQLWGMILFMHTISVLASLKCLEKDRAKAEEVLERLEFSPLYKE